MNNALIFQGVRKTWPGTARPALDGLDLEIPPGSAFGLLGPNGAGKSTLINILLGLVRKDEGQVLAGGCDLDSDPAGVRQHCGLAPQSPGLYPSLTVRENLDIFARGRGLKGEARLQQIDSAMQATAISSRADTRAEQLSGGLRQRLNVSLALLGQPPILILDEPTSGVDLQSRQLILELLRQENARGTTILYASHELDEVEELCSHVAILSRGQCRFSGRLDTLEVEAVHYARPQLARTYFELTGADAHH